MKFTRLPIFAAVVCLTFSQLSSALTSDRDQPAEIEADNTEIDFQTGVRTLTDKVLIVQGTLRLKADKLVATYKGSELVKAVADGSLARFKQRPDDQPKDVEGWAKKMIVDYPSNTLTLIGNASLKQGESTARGEKIVYNMSTDKLRIMGGSTINTAGKDGKARPKRKIEDPFKDDNNSAPEKRSASTAKGATADQADDQSDTAEQSVAAEETHEPAAAPVKSGRSRLIIQPKKKKNK